MRFVQSMCFLHTRLCRAKPAPACFLRFGIKFFCCLPPTCMSPLGRTRFSSARGSVCTRWQAIVLAADRDRREIIGMILWMRRYSTSPARSQTRCALQHLVLRTSTLGRNTARWVSTWPLGTGRLSQRSLARDYIATRTNTLRARSPQIYILSMVSNVPRTSP